MKEPVCIESSHRPAPQSRNGGISRWGLYDSFPSGAQRPQEEALPPGVTTLAISQGCGWGHSSRRRWLRFEVRTTFPFDVRCVPQAAGEDRFRFLDGNGALRSCSRDGQGWPRVVVQTIVSSSRRFFGFLEAAQRDFGFGSANGFKGQGARDGVWDSRWH